LANPQPLRQGSEVGFPIEHSEARAMDDDRAGDTFEIVRRRQRGRRCVNTASLDFYRNSGPFKFTAFGIDVVKGIAQTGDLVFTVDGGTLTVPFDQTGLTTVPVPFLGLIDPAGFTDAILTPTQLGDLFSYDRLQTALLTPSTPGVPEPAAWTMMFVGFGAVGGVLRSRTCRRALA